tara:strand:- start:120 stop:1289 length:1170 start_codon:yes stop_codon:yes gene_type:complete
MPEPDQILDKYAQLKLELREKEEEKKRKIQEELDAKDPLKQYEKIQRELADSKKKFAKEIQESNKKVEEEKKKQVEASQKEQSEKEEKALKNLENLFLKLGGNLEEVEEEEKKLNEDDIGSEPETLEVAETQEQEDVVEEPVGVVEEGIGHEKDVEDDEKREEIAEQEEETTVDAVADAISKQEKDKEKPKETSASKRIKILEEKVTKIIKQMSTIGGGGEVNLNRLDDVDTTGIANDKILKYNATSGKWQMADDGGGSGTDVDLSAVAQNIIPDADGTRDLGSASKKFRDLFVSGSSIVLGTTTLAVDGTGNLTVTPAGQSASPVVTQAATTNTFATVAVSGQNNVVADQGGDTLTLVGTGDTTITTNSGTDTVTIDTTVDTIDGGNF